MLVETLAVVAILFVVYYVVGDVLGKPKSDSLQGLHVLITGGSSGIGKSVAIEVARRGAHITLMARNVEKLEAAKLEILKHCIHPEQQKVRYISIDISDNYDAVEKSILSAEEDIGPIYMLVNCAGMAICGRLEDAAVEDMKYQINLNLLGTLFATKAVIPRMKVHRQGRIVFVSSQGGLLGIYGYSTYSSTKFALRGLAEAVQMEVKPYNITVTLSFPPDTDTPGFATEEKTKPMETRLISQSAGLVLPDVVAKQLVLDALRGRFLSTIGFEGFLLATVCAGMAPVTSIVQFVIQVLLMGIFRIVGVGYLVWFDRIIQNCMKTRDKTKRSE